MLYIYVQCKYMTYINHIIYEEPIMEVRITYISKRGFTPLEIRNLNNNFNN